MGFINKGNNISFLALKPSCLLFIFFMDNVVKAIFFSSQMDSTASSQFCHLVLISI